jgi:hypothetical protein
MKLFNTLDHARAPKGTLSASPPEASSGERPVSARGAGLSVDQSAAVARLTKLFERSSEAAKIGVWECNLAGEQLSWTDVVYDIFDLPRG